MPLDVVWDMETSDPDDFLTLIFLAGHPAVNLKAVTVVPGAADQIGLVRHALRGWFSKNIPVGARRLTAEKNAVSEWHYQAYGAIPPSLEALPADEVLVQCCDEQTTLITGAALTNVRSAITRAAEHGSHFRVGRIVVQGGFAGEGVVPPERQLEKFKGLRTAPTHNLMGDSKAAQAVLDHNGFGKRLFVSKNVCHRVYYDQAMHNLFRDLKDRSLAHQLIWQGMEVYLQKHPAGKLLHDPLAACCALDEGIGTWAEVELFREGSVWGSRLAQGSNTWIITDYDHERFLKIWTINS